MIHLQLQSFTDVRNQLTAMIVNAPPVRTERWQGRDVSKDPAATTYELRNVTFEVPLQYIKDLDHWRRDCAPNLPWADDHFKERVGGEPLNPGVEWANWPWAQSADKFRSQDQFNHTYMERLWPKWARIADVLPMTLGTRKQPHRSTWVEPHKGHGWRYGDLEDLIQLLAKEPFTRQAYIPLFFPEDTGIGDGGRKVCTLGYQILVRTNEAGVHEAHIWYPLRSCDLIRHWSDDCYLAVRLLLWIIEQCAERSDFWKQVHPGSYAMHMTSLHIFENDKRAILERT